MTKSRPLIVIVAALVVSLLLGSQEIRAKDEENAKKTVEAKQDAVPAKTEDGDENILLNPSFEEGDKLPQAWSIGQKVDGVTFLWDKQKSKTGKASMCLKKSVKKYFPIADLIQTVDRKDGSKSLKVSAQVKAEGAYKAVIDVLFLDKDSQWVSHEWTSYIGAKAAGDKPANHDWKEYSGKVEIPDTAKKIVIGLQIYGPGKVWFDDVQAEYVK